MSNKAREKKTKVVDTISEKDPNLVFHYPVFSLPNDPMNHFIIPSVFYSVPFQEVMYYSRHPEKMQENENLTKAMERASEKALEYRNKGFVLEGLFTTRGDDEEDYPMASISSSTLDKLAIILIRGTRYDMARIENDMVTIN